MHKNGLIYRLNISPAFTEKEGEIAGIFAGDGSQYFEPKAYHYEVNVHFGMKNLNYAFYVKSLFEGFFKKKFRLQQEGAKLRLRTYSKELYLFFKNYLEYEPKIKHSTVKLKHNNFPLEFKIGFLRGLIDTDGYVRNDKRIRQIVFCTTSNELINQIKVILSELGIKHGSHSQLRKYRNEKRVFYINVWEESIDKFINIINPLKARTEKGW